MEEEIQQVKDETQKLSNDMNILRNEMSLLRTSNVQLREPIDIYTKQSIKNVIIDNLPDILWDNVFHIASFATSSVYNITGTFTVTIATPAVFTKSSHGLVSGNSVVFSTTGALPTGLTAGTTYYVIATGLTSSEFQVSTTIGGSAVNTSGTQSGTHTLGQTNEVLSSSARESDTTGGKIFLPSINSKFKTAFYLGAGISKSTVYLMAPAVSTLTSIGTSIIDANKSGVGIKIVHGVVSAMSSTLGTVTLLPTGITITDDTTHVLEVQYYISHAIIKFNNVIVGDISCNLRPNTTFGTFFPFLTSIGSDDGTSVNITLERYEFLQKRK